MKNSKSFIFILLSARGVVKWESKTVARTLLLVPRFALGERISLSSTLLPCLPGTAPNQYPGTSNGFLIPHLKSSRGMGYNDKETIENLGIQRGRNLRRKGPLIGGEKKNDASRFDGSRVGFWRRSGNPGGSEDRRPSGGIRDECAHRPDGAKYPGGEGHS